MSAPKVSSRLAALVMAAAVVRCSQESVDPIDGHFYWPGVQTSAVGLVRRCAAGEYCWYIPPPAPANAHSNPTNYRLAFSVPVGSSEGTYSVNGATPVPFTVTAGTRPNSMSPPAPSRSALSTVLSRAGLSSTRTWHWRCRSCGRRRIRKTRLR